MMWTQKEASLLEDLKSQEKLCVEKYSKYAAQAADPQLKQLFTQIQQTEQQHEQTVTAMLNGQIPQMPAAAQQSAPAGQMNQQPAYKAQPTPEKQADAYLCQDALCTEKEVSGAYDTAVFEFRTPAARQALNEIQRAEQHHGEMIYAYMARHGMYA